AGRTHATANRSSPCSTAGKRHSSVSTRKAARSASSPPTSRWSPAPSTPTAARSTALSSECSAATTDLTAAAAGGASFTACGLTEGHAPRARTDLYWSENDLPTHPTTPISRQPTVSSVTHAPHMKPKAPSGVILIGEPRFCTGDPWLL